MCVCLYIPGCANMPGMIVIVDVEVDRGRGRCDCANVLSSVGRGEGRWMKRDTNMCVRGGGRGRGRAMLR